MLSGTVTEVNGKASYDSVTILQSACLKGRRTIKAFSVGSDPKIIFAYAGTIFWTCVLLTLQATISCNNIKAPVTCYKCDHMVHAASCNTTTKCNAGEICAIRKFRGSRGEFQSSGCIKEATCTANGQMLSIVGKRQHLRMVPDNNIQRRQNTLLCEKCCYGDKCNVLDCTTSSIMTSTTAAPACQDKVSQCSNAVYRNAICQDEHNAITFCQHSCGKCPVNGGFSSWMPWSDCSISCGASGESFRVRACDNPKPMYKGAPCQGQTMEIQQCNNGPCPVDGNWSAWGQWLPCNATCGVGTTMRIRSCSNPVPRHGGRPCNNPASFVETKQCNKQTCPVLSTTRLPTNSSTVCQDQPLCSDPHMMVTACTDLYLATTFCPKLCHKCGPTIIPPTCSDLVGQKCSDPLYQQFVCQDPDLIDLCRFTCGKCQP